MVVRYVGRVYIYIYLYVYIVSDQICIILHYTGGFIYLFINILSIQCQEILF